MQLWKRFWNEEDGQDLVEYTLLLAFVALASAALFINAGTSINTSGRRRTTAGQRSSIVPAASPGTSPAEGGGPLPRSASFPESQAMKPQLERLWRERGAQDLVEYTLLMAFLVLASAALYLNVSQTINALWTAISSRLAT
jgi:Flp pilus assembly pilin Flp